MKTHNYRQCDKVISLVDRIESKQELINYVVNEIKCKLEHMNIRDIETISFKMFKEGYFGSSVNDLDMEEC